MKILPNASIVLLICLAVAGCSPSVDIQLPNPDGLNPFYPIGIHEATGTMADKLVISRYGTAKPVLVYLPPGEGPHPLVIFQHGRPFSMPSNNAYYPDRALVNATIDSGYALAVVVRPGYFGVPGADSEAVPCNAPSLADFQTAGSVSALAVSQAHNYLKRQRFIDAERIVIAGTSAGGFASINAMGLLDDEILAAVSINGGRCGRRGEAIGGLSAMRVLYESIAEKAESPVYFLAGGNDDTIPVYSTRSLFMSFCRTRDDCVERVRTNLYENSVANHNVSTMVDVYRRALGEVLNGSL